MIERRGEAVKDLIIRGESHDLDRRATKMVPNPDSRLSDTNLFQNLDNKYMKINVNKRDVSGNKPDPTCRYKLSHDWRKLVFGVSESGLTQVCLSSHRNGLEF